MAEAKLLRRQLFVRGLIDEDRERVGDGNPPKTRHADLDLAREHLRVRLGARRDDARRLHDILRVQLRHELEAGGVGPLRAEGQLEQAGPVAQIDEEESSEVATAVYPSDDPDFASGPRGLDLPAAGVAQGGLEGGRLTPFGR